MRKNEFIQELLIELSYRSDEGYPILTKDTHISILSEILDEWGYSDIKNELINNLLEAEAKSDEDKEYKGIGGQPPQYVKANDFEKYERNPKGYSGKRYKQTDSGAYVEVDKDGNEIDSSDKEQDSTFWNYTKTDTNGDSNVVAKLKKTNTKINDLRIPADKESTASTKKRRDEINKLTDELIKDSNGSSKLIKNLIDKRREGLIQLHDKPPGGGGSLVGEMYGGVAAEEISKNPNLSEDEFVSEKMRELEGTPLYDELLEKAKASKATQKNPQKYIENWLRTAFRTGKSEIDYLKSEPKFKYKELQNEPYPISFTMDFNQSQIVKSKLETELEKAKEQGDDTKVKHYEKQLRILKRLPDTDTGILYKTTDGLIGFKHTSNKNDWNDPHNNTSVREKGKKMDKNMESVGRANNLDEDVVSDIKNNLNDLVSDTADLVDSAEKVVERDVRGVNSKEFAKNNAEVFKYLNPKRIDYPQLIRTAPSVKSYFFDRGIDINDVSDAELLEAVVEMTKNGTAPQDVSKIVLKISELTKLVRTRREEGLAKYGGPMSDEQIAENEGLPLEVVKSLQNPINDSILNTNRARKDTMGVAHEQMVSGILNKDEQLAQQLDKDFYPNPDDADNGPCTQAYVSSFMDEIHFTRYIDGEFEGAQSINIDGTNVTPQNFRNCLSKLSGFEGNPNEDKEGLKNHLRKRMRISPNGASITFSGNRDGESVEVGIENYRTKGNSKSILAHLGKDLISCLKEETK